ARRIAAFEESLGAPLFDRVGGDCTPTPAGKDLVEAAAEIEARADAVERRLARRDGERAGEGAIATMERLAAKLTEHVLAFARLHPTVHVRIHATNASVDLAKREADIALRATAAPPPSLVGRRLANVAFAVFGVEGTTLEASPWVSFDASLA